MVLPFTTQSRFAPAKHIDRPDHVGVVGIATRHARELCLGAAALRRHMATRGSAPSGVIFIGVIAWQPDAIGAPEAVRRKHEQLDESLRQLETFCARAGLATDRVVSHGTNPVTEIERLIKETIVRFPGCVCFTNRFILPPDRRLGEWLHNQTPLGLQRRLHLEGIPLVVLPITLR